MENVSDYRLEVSSPGFIVATGDTRRVEVLRSPLVKDHKRLYAPVREFIERHGLVLQSRAMVDDDDYMNARVEMSTFAAP